MHDEEYYEPSDEELREIEEILNKEREEEEKNCSEDCGNCNPFDNPNYKLPEMKNKKRKLYTFNSESHWAGWLKIHGIEWK